MFSLARTAALAAMVIVALAATVPARSPLQASQTKQPTGSISGRVTIGDAPARGVTVLLQRDNQGQLAPPGRGHEHNH